MHGRVQHRGEGFRTLRRRNSLHMRSVPPLVSKDDSEAPVPGDRCSSVGAVRISAAGDSFFKDGRKIGVGDCALFKPPQESPPFIGLIRWLKVGKENTLQLGVSWLYRTAQLNLGKGVSVEGAPNEVFYSFHKDEIPAASLLHPCKVAFLPRGVELPTGASSFVCRRVYDIEKKILWWLTDKDHIDEREEVDKLLQKTRTELHAMLQPDGRSPKQINGPTLTSQSKPIADSGQNSGTSLHSQGKGTKRERSDHGSEPIKRERSLKADDADSLQCKIESNLRSEIAQITEKGGVVNLEGVDRLVRLMQPEGKEGKMDMSSRSMLAGVMAATDRADCLNRFVYLRGLGVLDEWLQDIHKGRIGDGHNMKDGEKSVEEFLLVLLRALDKLPVNLQALQMCNIGRSVNLLRSHKNTEIQRKARALVDTWKKRVEAEMISNDAKSGSTQGVSWPSKSRLPDSSQVGVRTPCGSEVATKNTSTPNSASKTITTRSSLGDGNGKFVASSLGTVKQETPTSLGQESNARNSAGVTLDMPQIKEERVNRSNQAHNINQFLPVKEEGKNAMVGLVTPNKMSSGNTRSKKVSGYPAISGSSNQKEMSPGRAPSSQKAAALEKKPHSGLSGYRVLDGPAQGNAEGNNHKLIVKIPNRVRSPAQGNPIVYVEDSTYMSSQIASPALSDNHEQLDRSSMEKIEVNNCHASSDANVESQQENESRDVSSGSADGVVGPQTAFADEGQSKAPGDSRMLVDSLPTGQHKFADLRSSSFSPMNALVESCAKYSEINTSPSLEDEGGMNLLASVATREMSSSYLVSPTASTERKASATEEDCVGDEAKSKSLEDQRQTYNDTDCDTKKQEAVHGGLRSEDGLPSSKRAKCSADPISGVCHASEDIPDSSRHSEISTKDMGNNGYPMYGISGEANEAGGSNSSPLTTADKARGSEPDEKLVGQITVSSKAGPDGNSKSENFQSDVEIEGETSADQRTVEAVNLKVEDNESCKVHHEMDADEVLEETNLKEIPASSVNISEHSEKSNGEKCHKAANEHKPLYEAAADTNVEETVREDGKNRMTKSRLKFDLPKGTDVQHTYVVERPHWGRVGHEVDHKDDLSLPNSARLQSDEPKGSAAIVAEVSSHTAATSDRDGKVKFDLNEGFSADEGKCVDHPVNLMSKPAQFFNSLKFSLNSIPHGHSSSITVASAAKGPFVPPDDLLRNKGELGWKGAAATSAFRPAEPRRAHETAVGPPFMPGPEASTSKPIRVPFDFDLNVPDEGLVKEMNYQNPSFSIDSTANFLNNSATSMKKTPSVRPVSSRSSGHLDLDLNSADEAGEDSTAHGKQLVGRNFDLNDGPGADDSNAEMFSVNQVNGGGKPPQQPPSAAGLRLNGPLGNFSTWFPSGNVYSTMAIPSMEHPFSVYPPNASQRQFAPHGASSPFMPEAFRGSVLSSSPAVNFPSGPFQFPVFPFGTSFPIPSATNSVNAGSYGEPSTGQRLFAPPLHPQMLGPVGTVPSQFPRPYVVSLQESSNNGFLDSSRKWARQGLDLNSGPGAADTEPNREEMFPIMASVQQSVGSSRPLREDQARIGKRKEPEGGSENESFSYKQSSWR